LANDQPPPGGSFNTSTLAVASSPTHGSAVVSNGEIIYTPVDQFSGTDSFTYTVEDNNNNLLGPALVRVVVNRPTANDDFALANSGTALAIDVLENDTDPDGPDRLDASTLAVVGAPAHGTAVVSNGEVVDTAAPGFGGTDTFFYTVKDVANATSNTARVTVLVNNPSAAGLLATTIGTNPVTLNVLPLGSDPRGPGNLLPGSVQVVSGPSHGSVS